MTIINSLKINELANSIEVDISSTDLSEVIFWTSKTFKDYSKALDISFLIPEKIGDRYIFKIKKEDVNLLNLNGIFFLEFNPQTEEAQTGLIANFMHYQECLLNKVLSTNIKGCKQQKSNCSDCEDNILTIQVLLDTLYSTVKMGLFEESIRIIEVLDEDCEVCNTCPSYEDITIVNGYGFGTLDNSIILI